MSNRTLLEINHDYWGRIKDNPQGFADLILAVLSSRDREAMTELESYGLTVGRMRHHSTPLKPDILAAFGGREI